jgi:hypothetical protein
LLSVSVAALFASRALAGSDILWHVPEPPATFYGTEYSVVYGTEFPRDQEVADDFEATGLVERVEVPGRGCGQCSPAEVLGVFVRFYAWTEDGPGALQHETLVAVDSGNYEGSTTQPFSIAVNLAEPFAASGWHFISVQVAFANGGIWNFKQSNRFNNINEPIHFRDNLDGGVWAQHTDGGGQLSQSDFAITLIGQAGATTPSVTGVSRETVTGSDRIIVSGSDFGAPGDGRLLVGGLEARVMEWSSTQVIGYVPEGLEPGAAELVVENLGTPSAGFPVTIVERAPNGRIDWVFEGSGSYISFAPTVGPDGTIYFSDVDGFLYAMSPDGALLWIVDAMRGAQGSANEAPVQVDPIDGTIYVATDPLGLSLKLEAFNPDGSHKWTSVVEFGSTWQAGPTIGPDGRLYAAASAATLLGGEFDVLAIGRDGDIDWTTAADPFVFEDAPGGAMMIFGSSSSGGPVDQMMFTADRNGDGRNWGFDIEDGSQNFATPTAGGNDVGQGQLANRYGDGPFYMFEFSGIGGAGWGLQAFDRDGDRTWRFDPDIRSGATRPSVGPDGTIYFGWDGLRMSAVDPDGEPIWTRLRDQGAYATVRPSPTSPIVLAVGGSPGQPSFAEARGAVDGDPIWEQALRDDEGADIAAGDRISVSPDGARLYFGAIALPLTPTSVFRVLAIRVEDPAPDCSGDTNGDGAVNFTDLNAVLAGFGQAGVGIPGDINGDGVVNFTDLNEVLTNFGGSCP